MALMTSPVDEDADYNAAVASGDIRNVLAVLERENKLPAGTLSKTAGIESGFNPNAKNPRSSAEGLFQFLDSTGRQYGLNSREEKRDPVLSALAGAQLAGDNATYLGQKIGRDPSGPEIYAAHQQGPAGAANIIANPSAPMPSLVGDKAARLNGAAGLTGGQFMDRFAAKFGMPSVAGTASTAATPLSGSEGSDTLTGSGGSDRFTSGLASKPYQPADEGSGIGDIISAIGLSMMSGRRGNLLGNLPTILTAQEKEKARREDRRYGMWRDERNFDVGRADAAQAQANAEASRALQVRGLDTQDKNAAFDQGLRTKADARAETQAAKPDVLRGPGNSVMERQDDGTYVTKVPGERAPTEYEKNLAAGKAQGLTGRDLQTYALTGKFEGAGNATNPYANPNGAKTTGEQDKSSGFADRMIQNEATLRPLESMGTSRNEKGANAIPVIGSYFTSDEFKKYQSAKDNWIAAQLRKESGAAIGQKEYEAADAQYFPQINDPPGVIEQKRKLRQTATEGMMRDGGPGYQPKAIFHPETGDIVPFKRPGSAPAPQSNFDISAIPEDARRAEARRRGLIQ